MDFNLVRQGRGKPIAKPLIYNSYCELSFTHKFPTKLRREKENVPNPFGRAQVVQKLDNAIHRINRYPENNLYENQLGYPLARNLSSG